MLSVLIHLDFVLAVALLVVAPLGLLVAARERPAVRGRLLAYWRTSSLLMITVYLMIGGRALAFVMGNAALLLIPLTLYYGDALCKAVGQPPDDGSVSDWFRRWRTTAAVFCGASLLLTGPALRCVWALGTSGSGCNAWLRPPRKLHRALHPSLDPATLGDLAMAGLLVYGAYLVASVVRVVRGLSLQDHTPRDVSDVNVSHADRIVAMTPSVARQLRSEHDVNLDALVTWAILDPYGGSLTDYRQCLEQISAALDDLLETGAA